MNTWARWYTRGAYMDLGTVPVRTEWRRDEGDNDPKIEGDKVPRRVHHPCIGNSPDERKCMSNTTDTFKYRGVTVVHHLELDIYYVRGETFIDLASVRRFVDDLV